MITLFIAFVYLVNFIMRMMFQDKKMKAEEETKSEQGDDQSVNQNSFEISKSEEESLMKLMDECNFASANAENFMQRLQAELLVLDTVSMIY